MIYVKLICILISLPMLTGCLVTKTVGAAVDVTATTAGAVIGATGDVIEGTVDVVTPDGKDDEDEG